MADAVLVVAGVLAAISRAGSDRVAVLTSGPDEPPGTVATARRLRPR